MATGPQQQIPFIQAAHFTPANRGRASAPGLPNPPTVDLVVLHSMESQEKPGTARAVAKWFATGERQASAHYCVDADEVVQCVREEDIAWHAPGANARGIGIEHAGRARQTAAEWEDEFSHAMLLRSIDLCERICRWWAIPAVLVDVAGLKAGERGITTHAAVSQAFHKSNHTDPGPAFPLAWFVACVAARLTGGEPHA